MSNEQLRYLGQKGIFNLLADKFTHEARSKFPSQLNFASAMVKLDAIMGYKVKYYYTEEDRKMFPDNNMCKTINELLRNLPGINYSDYESDSEKCTLYASFNLA